MKVKRLPEDFVVEELTDLQPGRQGEFSLYRLRKQGLSTLEAVAAIQRRWELPRRKLSWGGLKDKYAVTTQYLTIHRGPQRELEQTHLTLEYLGRVERPFEAGDIRANRFDLALRAMTSGDVARAQEALPALARWGLPNYFDDQRFGSVGSSGEFIAEPWIRGDYERTLWLALAEPNRSDRPEERSEKELLRQHWGEWRECKRLLSRSHRRSIVTFLDDRPGDFKGAWARVNQDLRSLYLAAFQSQLWNELLAALIRRHAPADALVEVGLRTGSLPFFHRLTDDASAVLSEAMLPLPSARIRPDDIVEPAMRELVQKTLSRRGLELRMLRVKYPRDTFFSKNWRRAVVPAVGLEHSTTADELHPGRQVLRLRFELPRGSYATILIKRLTDAAEFDDEAESAG